MIDPLEAVGLLESIYRVGQAPAAWLDEVRCRAAADLDQGRGVQGYFIDLLPAPAAAAATVAGSREDQPAAAPAKPAEEPLLPLPVWYPGPTGVPLPCGFASDLPRDAFRKAGRHLFALADADDVFCVSGLDSAGSGCVLVAFVPRGAMRQRPDQRLWRRLAAHLSTGARLVQRLSAVGAGPEREAEAVLRVDGTRLSANTRARRGAARLQAGAQRIAAARRAGTPRLATRQWRPLWAGRYSLVPHISADGEQQLLACANLPSAPQRGHLLPWEARVCGYGALRHDDALIAYETGLRRGRARTFALQADQKLRIPHPEERDRAYWEWLSENR